jgi:7,8-dihydropterin-6-yl-methyl-4-(beta-D-ribofuranosyl)aminobenzene 5'-phosphate synthase
MGGLTVNKYIAVVTGLFVISSASLSVFAAESTGTIQVVYDNYAFNDTCDTDWGFACVIKGTEKTILFDTGAKGDLLLANLEQMNVRPSDIELVVISHNHRDHTGGLGSFLKENRDVSVFLPADTTEGVVNDVKKHAAEATVVSQSATICRGAVVVGPMGESIVEQALILDTEDGLVILTGCSHPGIVEIAEREARTPPEHLHGYRWNAPFATFGGRPE